MNRREFLAAAAQLGLVAVTAEDAKRLFAAEKTGTVTGRVLGDGTPLEGVLVSDGRHVVRTNAQGIYKLTIGPESGRFLFVTTPRGYWADRFFVPIGEASRAGQADFVLRPVNQPDRFDFVFMADMHIERRQFGVPKLKATIEEINQSQPGTAFLWAQGDICLQSGMGKDYVECLSVARMPVRNGAGNHEMMLKHENPRDDFEQLFGPTYYSFDWGTIHCIVLDGNKPIPNQDGWKAVHGAVEGNELEWLKADLAAQPKGKPIVVGVHIPIVSSYPERRQHSPKDAPYWEMANDNVLTDLFSQHDVRLVFQGHMHENERQRIGGVEYVASISVSGSWWKAGTGLERGVDGSPRGYRIVSVDGTTVTHRYQSSCESRVERQGEFYGLDRPISAGQKTSFVFNCYDAPNDSTAQARIDGGSWQPMPAYPATSVTTSDLTMPHHFRFQADTTSLSPAKHRIEARVRWPDGTTVQEAGTFQLQKAVSLRERKVIGV